MDIREHMEVVDANDQHVGTVAAVEGNSIRLAEADALDPRELMIDLGRVESVGANKVRLSATISAVTTRAFLAPDETTDSKGK